MKIVIVLLTALFLSSTIVFVTATDVPPGRMYKKSFDDFGLHPKNLSRVLEDAGTLSSPLIPWNSCGAFMGATLGVSPLLYLPYAFLNLINPVVSIFYGYTGITMEKADKKDEQGGQKK